MRPVIYFLFFLFELIVLLAFSYIIEGDSYYLSSFFLSSSFRFYFSKSIYSNSLFAYASSFLLIIYPMVRFITLLCSPMWLSNFDRFIFFFDRFTCSRIGITFLFSSYLVRSLTMS
jgi:hypothetical protein